MYLFLDLLALPLYPCHLGLDPLSDLVNCPDDHISAWASQALDLISQYTTGITLQQARQKILNTQSPYPCCDNCAQHQNAICYHLFGTPGNREALLYRQETITADTPAPTYTEILKETSSKPKNSFGSANYDRHPQYYASKRTHNSQNV